jgi:hypothetical protein
MDLYGKERQMKKLIVGGALAVALAVPAAAVADEPTQTDFKNAAKECKALRTSAGKDNFTQMFGGKEKNAFGKCVSQRAKQNHQQTVTAQKNAAKECKALRDSNPQAFKDQYKNLGQCVSQKARQHEQEQAQQEQQQDKAEQNAAKKCKAQRKSDPDGFSHQWGSRRNAFGKCVSRTANGSVGQYTES